MTNTQSFIEFIYEFWWSILTESFNRIILSSFPYINPIAIVIFFTFLLAPIAPIIVILIERENEEGKDEYEDNYEDNCPNVGDD